MIILGIGVVGTMQLLAAGTMANADSAELTTAVNLAGDVEEMLQGATYSTLKSTYDNKSYSTVVDGGGSTMSGFTGWSQSIRVQYVDVNSVATTQPDTTVTDMSRVTVSITHNNAVVYSTSWVAIAP